ncbi:hypothetical protein AMTRI_Chr02g254070 [Amborella trichopoda]
MASHKISLLLAMFIVMSLLSDNACLGACRLIETPPPHLILKVYSLFIYFF